ncbi:hypothetical protein K491DRAFT_8663 [Lophiostoma macrostomum CBS 122681]|uniref:RBR-type E3 ubiquitin transferase n=1 Tax=Lophiostoma macrostomum CBS 122681 TaxID=1314788 RepID=A0A6A6TU35_9PLEO|nr:hypothetical protein K491DRAFT_8663 [Lophiostoma macrostomum CBS 122681]
MSTVTESTWTRLPPDSEDDSWSDEDELADWMEFTSASLAWGLRKPRQDSRKAQQLLGLVIDLGDARGRPNRFGRRRTRSLSEERPLTTRTSFYGSSREGSIPIAMPLSLQSGAEHRTSQLVSLDALRDGEVVNFSRPLSISSPRAVDGEFSMQIMQGKQPDVTRPRIKKVTRDDIGLPRTPSAAGTLAIARPIFERTKEERRDGTLDQRRRRPSLWNAVPLCITWVSTSKKKEVVKKDPAVRLKDESRSQTRLTESNLRHHEGQIGAGRQSVNSSLVPMIVRPPPNFGNPRTTEKALPTRPASPTFAMPEQSLVKVPLAKPRNEPVMLHVNRPLSLASFVARLSTCEVCKDLKPPSAFPIRQCTSRCTHPPHTCMPCIRDWISATIESKGWDQCACPECNELMDYTDVKFFATGDIFLRYDALAARAALSQIPNFHWCLSPDCSSGQIHPYELSQNPTFVCTACSHTYCLNHASTPYHSGLSCTEYDAFLSARNSVASPPPSPLLASASSERRQLRKAARQVKADAKLAQQIGKRCPNSECGWWIEKNEGCDHMTCSKCQFEFCWLCGAGFEQIIEKGNRMHKKGCRYYGS